MQNRRCETRDVPFGAGLVSSIELVQNWFEELKAKGIGR